MTLAKKQGRPDPYRFDQPWRATDPCPCDLTAKRYFDCCLHEDGGPRIVVPRIFSGIPVTGLQNSACYLRATNDCVEKLSREHYVSANILGQIGNELHVSGFHWQEPDTQQTIAVNSLTAKILCERHNNVLSPIDQYAGKTFSALTLSAQHAMKTSLSKRTAIQLASGDALERWAIKTLLGTYFARIARADGGAVVDNYEIDLDKLIPAMFGRPLVPPLGMYASLAVGSVIKNNIGFAPLMLEQSPVVAGLQVKMRGLDFSFIFDERAGALPAFRDHPFHRPVLIDFDGPARTGRLAFTWEHQRNLGRRVAVTLSREV